VFEKIGAGADWAGGAGVEETQAREACNGADVVAFEFEADNNSLGAGTWDFSMAWVPPTNGTNGNDRRVTDIGAAGLVPVTTASADDEGLVFLGNVGTGTSSGRVRMKFPDVGGVKIGVTPNATSLNGSGVNCRIWLWVDRGQN
jgi:hypothetical protein